MAKVFGPLNNFDGLAPTTTKGDLIARDTSTNVRVPAGVDGTFLQAASGSTGGVAWASVAGSNLNVSTLTGATTLTSGNDVVLVSGTTFTVTFPAASGNTGKVIQITKTDSTATAQVANGFTLATQNESYTFFSSGASWMVREHRWDGGFTAFTPSAVGTYTLNATWTGTWAREGSQAMVCWSVVFGNTTNVPTASSCNMPASFIIGLSAMPALQNLNRSALLGSGIFDNANAGVINLRVDLQSSTQVILKGLRTPAGATLLAVQALGNTLPAATSSGDQITAWAKIPIQGWGG